MNIPTEAEISEMLEFFHQWHEVINKIKQYYNGRIISIADKYYVIGAFSVFRAMIVMCSPIWQANGNYSMISNDYLYTNMAHACGSTRKKPTK